LPRKKHNKKTNQQKFALALVFVLVIAVFSSLFLAFPNLRENLFRSSGIIEEQNVPSLSVSAGTAGDVGAKIHVIDVGQGDATLVENDGLFALIDAGTPESEDDLVEYLKTANVNKLQYLFMTHPHADHIGGMQAVVENFAIETIILPNFFEEMPTTSIFEDLLSSMLAKGTKTQTALLGAQYTLGSGVFSIIHAGVPPKDNFNLISLGIRFDDGEFSFLNSGDGEKVNEKTMLENGENLQADVFLAAHHGSIATSNTKDFISAVSPKFAVVSAGAQNSYGHPHKEALDNYEAVGAQILRTDENGNIVFLANGDSVEYAVERGA
jgi:beta-lactamase superfamily II metal-dependent hydrolase